MPFYIQHPKRLFNRVPSQHLQRHDQRILHEVAKHFPMKNLHRAIIARRTEQRQAAMVILDAANGLLMIPEGSIRLRGEVQVVPEEALVIRSDDEIVTTTVYVKGRDPAGARLQRLDQFLLCQVVGADVALRRYE